MMDVSCERNREVQGKHEQTFDQHQRKQLDEGASLLAAIPGRPVPSPSSTACLLVQSPATDVSHNHTHPITTNSRQPYRPS
jgi:hypothetical protein